ncbi:MAG TPA: TonB-dependent receptor [Caulobacteraceae bacterium]
MGGAAGIAIAWSGAAAAEEASFSIAPQPLASALNEFSVQSKQSVLFTTDLAAAKASKGVSGEVDVAQALTALLDGTGLTYRRNGDTFLVVRADGPQSGSAAGGGAEVEALIVTAQKREEDIQDVPIAISAFTQEDLTRSQVAGGPDLITQVPNMTFTKTNFSSYSVQLRGIGTQAISATVDPAVAVAFNNTPFTRNRFFEQEFYDLQRVEVLRGPQGTLYGRNATAGVVNIISAKPKFLVEARASGDVSNYSSSRIEGMVNIPLVEDVVALRLAGAWTKRDGYATNELTGNPIDGRDLWSTRLSLRFAPTDRIDANLIWEHFEEDDDRLRSGKQLCKKDIVTEVGGVAVDSSGGLAGFAGTQGTFSQGCVRESLYSPDSFETPNGYAVPYYHPLGAIFLPVVPGKDPYVNNFQSRDLRVIESTVDPEYRAKTDVVEAQISFDLTDDLSLVSETAYGSDLVYSFQDFNRFNTAPGAWSPNFSLINRGILEINSQGNAEFCDPQIGCSDRLVAVDISTAKARQFSQEFRLGSDFDGPFNFSLGANFMRADSEDKYYVFINALTLYAAISPYANTTPPGPYVQNVTDNSGCLPYGPMQPLWNWQFEAVGGCQYIDPNPIGNLNDQGHNYFLSRNPYKLISYAVFGETYYNVTDALKITAGLRWTVDKKEAPRIPSWVLAGDTVGLPVAEVIEQEWREPTGRLTVDWKPDLAWTDETLLYASYAHGYKAGGANPPSAGIVVYGLSGGQGQILADDSATRPKRFDPEFIDAFEVGSKNTLLDGALTLNLAAFYYDYTGYQVSAIVDRAAYNYNYDATVWGIEWEADWRPLENLRFGIKGGYEKTRIADGEEAIDLMDRTAGDPAWTVVKPFPTFTQNCIVRTDMLAYQAASESAPKVHIPGNSSGGGPGICDALYLFGQGDMLYSFSGVPQPPGYTGFDPDDYPEINNGEGIMKKLGGNPLPNAPEWTATLTADYTLPLPNDWLATLHTDLHWQAESYWRIFDDHEYDKLDEYFTMNLAAIFTNEEAGWNIMAYIKNVTDETAITGAFLNSDDTGLTTNVFLTEPRLYGLRVTKEWKGGPLLGGFGARREGPYPLTVEVGGQVQRWDAPDAIFRPDFASAFSDEIEPFSDQDGNLDWGDGRDVKITYAPDANWQVSLAARFGKTNGVHKALRSEAEAHLGCVLDLPPYYVGICAKYAEQGGGPQYGYSIRHNSSSSEVRNREDHTVVDFAVGRDVGMGGTGLGLSSTVSAGLRYAALNSWTSIDGYGLPDWDLSDAKYAGALVHRYEMDVEARREFQGVGPMLSWEASQKLLGGPDTGKLNVDWALSGGALFGKRKTIVTGSTTATFERFTGFEVDDLQPPIDGPDVTPVEYRRSNDVTVPVVGASLGLSYEVDRVSIGAGYRWERYFDAIDGGFEERESEDRTIDGPYFKIAVGFGG